MPILCNYYFLANFGAQFNCWLLRLVVSYKSIDCLQFPQNWDISTLLSCSFICRQAKLLCNLKSQTMRNLWICLTTPGFIPGRGKPVGAAAAAGSVIGSAVNLACTISFVHSCRTISNFSFDKRQQTQTQTPTQLTLISLCSHFMYLCAVSPSLSLPVCVFAQIVRCAWRCK